MEPRPILLTDREAGKLLRILPERLVRLARQGQVPCVMLPGDEVRFIEDDLREWVRNRRQPVTAAKPASAALLEPVH